MKWFATAALAAIGGVVAVAVAVFLFQPPGLYWKNPGAFAAIAASVAAIIVVWVPESWLKK